MLRNNSGHTCTTFGYPGLQTETVNQQLQTTTVTREDESAVTTLTLAQGASVSTLDGLMEAVGAGLGVAITVPPAVDTLGAAAGVAVTLVS